MISARHAVSPDRRARGGHSAIAQRDRPPDKGGDAMSSTTTDSRRAVSARENAARSTGPRTDSGKKRSARNATTHGAFCADLLHPSESAELFHTMRHAILEDLSPGTVLELALADRVVAAQ